MCTYMCIGICIYTLPSVKRLSCRYAAPTSLTWFQIEELFTIEKHEDKKSRYRPTKESLEQLTDEYNHIKVSLSKRARDINRA